MRSHSFVLLNTEWTPLNKHRAAMVTLLWEMLWYSLTNQSTHLLSTYYLNSQMGFTKEFRVRHWPPKGSHVAVDGASEHRERAGKDSA